ncbi:MAG: efflux transporter periplasmic adaptor subunit, partial [Pseudomonadota bacterium]
ALVVAEGAVVVEGESVYVFVVEDGRARRRDVELGQREPGLVEVTSGLAVDEMVVVEGIGRLRDDVPVRLRETAPATAAPVAGGGGRAPA